MDPTMTPGTGLDRLTGRVVSVAFDPVEISSPPILPLGRIVWVYPHPPPPFDVLIELSKEAAFEWRVSVDRIGRAAKWQRRPIRFRYLLLHVWRDTTGAATQELEGRPPDGVPRQRMAYAKTGDLAVLEEGEKPDLRLFGSLGPCVVRFT